MKYYEIFAKRGVESEARPIPPYHAKTGERIMTDLMPESYSMPVAESFLAKSAVIFDKNNEKVGTKLIWSEQPNFKDFYCPVICPSHDFTPKNWINNNEYGGATMGFLLSEKMKSIFDKFSLIPSGSIPVLLRHKEEVRKYYFWSFIIIGVVPVPRRMREDLVYVANEDSVVFERATMKRGRMIKTGEVASLDKKQSLHHESRDISYLKEYKFKEYYDVFYYRVPMSLVVNEYVLNEMLQSNCSNFYYRSIMHLPSMPPKPHPDVFTMPEVSFDFLKES